MPFPKPWFAIDEHIEQLRERLLTLQRDAEHLQSVLSTLPKWRRRTMAYEMMTRALSNVAGFAGWNLLYVLDLRDSPPRLVDLSDMKRFQDVVRCESKLAMNEVRLAAYRVVVHQRASLSDRWDWTAVVEDPDGLHDLEGFWTAIDAVLLDFYESIYGVGWVEMNESKRKPWLPVAVLGHAYSIEPAARVTNVPQAELLRIRLLASLAHEIAHLKVRELFFEGKLLWPKGWDPSTKGLDEAEVDRLDWHKLEALGAQEGKRYDIACYFEDLAHKIHDVHCQVAPSLRDGPRVDYWAPQFREFLCDAISIHVAGPAALLAYMVHFYPRLPNEPKIKTCVINDHPPQLTRMRIMARELQSRGLGEVLQECGIPEYLDSVRALNPGAWDALLLEWDGAEEAIADCALTLAELILPKTTEPFNDPMMGGLRARIDQGNDFDETLRPHDLVNLVWLKRMAVKDSVLQYFNRLPGADREKERAVRVGCCDPLPRVTAGVVSALNRFGGREWDRLRKLTIKES